MRKLKTRKGLAMLTVAAMAFLGIGYGLFNALSAQAVTSGTTIRGVIGGDFDSQLPAGSVNGADWGVDTTLIPHAGNLIHDNQVFVNVNGWLGGAGQTQPTTTDTSSACNGTPAAPTASGGLVCIYVGGGDNAADVSGDSIMPGTGGSRLGFKLIWDSSAHNGDTFIDATWAYTFP